MKVLLYAPEYRPNLSNMIRTVEFYGLKEIYIYDQNGLMNPPSNKVSRADMNHMARVWTAGAIEHIDIKVIKDPLQFISDHDGNVISTVISTDAQSIHDFRFQTDDLIVMGPEKEGLHNKVIEACNSQLFIPNRGITDCLNVSVSLGIILNEAIRQTLY